MEVLNLDKLVASLIHHPKVDGIPLYTRVDGQLESGDNKVLNNKSDRWVEASKVCCGSPDNIKRVFITYKGVYTHLYRPVLGARDQSLKREKMYNTDFSQVYADIQRSIATATPRNYVVRGLGLKAFYRPWVCSNIEEIYFDWVLFLSDDVQNLGLGDFFRLYAPGQCKLLPPGPIKMLFEVAALRGVKDIRDRFPRLRCIGYIQELEAIYHRVPGKPGEETIEDMVKPWYTNAYVGAAIKNPNCAVSIYNIPNVPKLNMVYSVKDGIYVFDRDVLRDYFSMQESRIKSYIAEQRDKRVDEAKEELVKKAQKAKSGFELTMDEIYAKEGPRGALAALKISMRGLSEEDKEKLLSNMSMEGQQRYRELLKSKV